MPVTNNSTHSRETVSKATSGALMLVVNLIILFGGIAMMVVGIINTVNVSARNQAARRQINLLERGVNAAPVVRESEAAYVPLIILGALCEPLALLMFFGHFTLQPKVARVMILFGDYRGTIRKSGFFWANPFYARSGVTSPCRAPRGRIPKPE